MKLSVCQQTQLSKEKMSCAEYDDKRKKNYIFKTEFLGPQKIITCCGGGGKSSKYLQHYHTWSGLLITDVLAKIAHF